jgi:hypothetical protein
MKVDPIDYAGALEARSIGAQMDADDDYDDRIAADELLAELCDDCGQYVPIGGWPFCASDRNPEGHAKGAAYAFKVRMGMKLNGWTRRER